MSAKAITSKESLQCKSQSHLLLSPDWRGSFSLQLTTTDIQCTQEVMVSFTLQHAMRLPTYAYCNIFASFSKLHIKFYIVLSNLSHTVTTSHALFLIQCICIFSDLLCIYTCVPSLRLCVPKLPIYIVCINREYIMF